MATRVRHVTVGFGALSISVVLTMYVVLIVFTPDVAHAAPAEDAPGAIASEGPAPLKAAKVCTNVGVPGLNVVTDGELGALAAGLGGEQAKAAVSGHLLRSRPRPAGSEPALIATIGADSDTASFNAIESGAATQLVGTVTTTGSILAFKFEHRLACGLQGDLAWRIDDRQAFLDLTNAAGSRVLVQALAPWAVDAKGQELDTWYEAEGATLVQRVDARRAVQPILFDPTYSPLECGNGYYSALNVVKYLDMEGLTDYGRCPVRGMFENRNGYFPVWGYETNVANDYGWVIVDQGGGCTDSPDTGPFFDFQIPCKAHDYCYDLRKAGFSGTVSDAGCDARFYELMLAHCNDRVLSQECALVAATYNAFVSSPTVVTNPDPAEVQVIAVHSFKCADVEASGQQDGARILQYDCTGTPNQKWKITPVSGEPGLFQLKPQHSGKCADLDWSAIPYPRLRQWTCTTATNRRFRIVGSRLQDAYTIRELFFGVESCWNVPGSSLGVVQLIGYSCSGETDNERWSIK